MYNSSIKGQNHDIVIGTFNIEIPHEVFFNDMSKNYFCEEWRDCDVIFSEIAWVYGYPRFNEKAKNEPNKYSEYLHNIHLLIEKMNVPSFIVCSKNLKRYFVGAKMYPFAITTSNTNMNGCTLYVWNYNKDISHIHDTNSLLDLLSKEFDKCLDFSCGYGEHLLKFKDFIGCDIDRNCLSYLSILKEQRNVCGSNA